MGLKHLFVRETLSPGQAMTAGLAGGIIGAAITYFFYGTELGARKRKVLSRTAKEVKNLASDAYQDLKYDDENDEIEISNKE